MLTTQNFEKELKSGKLEGIYLLFGEELFLLESSLKRMKKIFGEELVKGINYVLVDNSNIGKIISEIETPSFGYEKKLIIARGTGIFAREGKRKNAEIASIKDKLREYIEENIEMINKTTVIIFVEETADSVQKLFKTIDKFGTICKFDLQKPNQITKRLKAICDSYGVQVEENTLFYLIEECGTNMQDLINEIRKLIEYAGAGGKIIKEAIDKLCIKKLESVIFDLTDNLGKKNITQALQVLNNLIYSKEPLQKILITLYNHFKKIYFTTLAIKGNKDVIITLDLKPNQTFLVNKYKAQARYFKESELKKILQCLRDLDYQYKNGLIDLQIGMETILCTYCS